MTSPLFFPILNLGILKQEVTMCVICDKLKEISTKQPIQITCYWSDKNRNCCITSDLSKCSIEILGDDGSPLVSMPITHCPACGEPIVKPEECKTFEDVVKREG